MKTDELRRYVCDKVRSQHPRAILDSHGGGFADPSAEMDDYGAVHVMDGIGGVLRLWSNSRWLRQLAIMLNELADESDRRRHEKRDGDGDA